MSDDAPLPLAPPEPPTPVLGWVLLATITGLALYLRLPYLNESLWLDELHTSWTIIDGWGPIYERAAIGNYSPAYFWLVRMVTEVAGHHEWSLRLLSLLAGTALVPAVGALTWRWTGALAAGLLAAWMATFDELGILFSVEGRPYALVALLAMVHIALSAELIQSHSLAKRAAWIALATALVYLHYTAVLLLAVEAAWYLLLALWRRMWPTYGLYYALIDGAIVAVLCIPAFWHLAEIGSHRDEWAQFVDRPSAAELVSKLPLGRDLLLPFTIAAALWGFLAWRREMPFWDEAAVIPAWLPLAAVWALVPVVATWILAANDLARLYHPRYLFFATPALFVLAAGLLTRMPAGWPRAGLWAVIAVVTLAVSPVFPWESFGGPASAWARSEPVIEHAVQDWRGAVDAAEDELTAHPGMVLVEANLIERDRLRDDPRPLAQEYLSFPLRGIYGRKIPRVIPLSAAEPGNVKVGSFQIVQRQRDDLLCLLSGDDPRELERLDLLLDRWRDQGTPFKIGNVRRFRGVTLVLLHDDRQEPLPRIRD